MKTTIIASAVFFNLTIANANTLFFSCVDHATKGQKSIAAFATMDDKTSKEMLILLNEGFGKENEGKMISLKAGNPGSLKSSDNKYHVILESSYAQLVDVNTPILFTQGNIQFQNELYVCNKLNIVPESLEDLQKQMTQGK